MHHIETKIEKLMAFLNSQIKLDTQLSEFIRDQLIDLVIIAKEHSI